MAGMVSITLPASEIPVGTEVRKPTGGKLYVLKAKIEAKWYEAGHAELPVIMEPGTLFLCTADGIYCTKADTKLSVDFDDYQEAIDFLERIKDREG